MGTNFSNPIDIKRLKHPSKPILDNKETNNFNHVITEMKEVFSKGISLRKVPERELKKTHSYQVHKALINKTDLPLDPLSGSGTSK